jgi:hypothetical protein
LLRRVDMAANAPLRIRNIDAPLKLPPPRPYSLVGRPRYLARGPVAPEIFQLVEAVQNAADAAARRLVAEAAAPTRIAEIQATVAKLMHLLLVGGEAGRASVFSQLDDLQARVARLEKAGER